VEDNLKNRSALKGILTRWGMKTTVVKGGHAALQAIEAAKRAGRSFPLILLHEQMPEKDGFTFAERIKRDPESAGTNYHFCSRLPGTWGTRPVAATSGFPPTL